MATDTFIDRMVDKTLGRTDVPLRRGQNYNYPTRWYATPNGDIVQLQSDPQNRALYADLGFHLLADTPARGQSMSEVEEWERIERPKLIVEQKRRANLINTIRRADSQNPMLMLNLDTIDEDSTEELEQMIKDIRAQGHNVRVTESGVRQRGRTVADDEPALLQGVERSETNSLEDLQRKLSAEGARATTIQGTGKDPIDEARRRSGK
jgi:hypothetical protein